MAPVDKISIVSIALCPKGNNNLDKQLFAEVMHPFMANNCNMTMVKQCQLSYSTIRT